MLDKFQATVAPLIPTLQSSLVHNDGNDHNIILDDRDNVVSIIDFGDMCWTPRVFSFAVAMAYGLVVRVIFFAYVPDYLQPYWIRTM